MTTALLVYQYSVTQEREREREREILHSTKSTTEINKLRQK